MFSDAGSRYQFMDMSAMNNGIHSTADRHRTSSPVDRISSTYFPFSLPASDAPFFPPSAEAFMQAAAAAAAAAAVGRPVPEAESPSRGVRSAGNDAPREELIRGELERSSPSVDDQVSE